MISSEGRATIHAARGLRLAEAAPKPSGPPDARAEDPEDDVVLVSVYLQDPEVDRQGPSTIAVPASHVRVVRDHLVGPHFSTVNDRNPHSLAPSEDGSFVFPARSPDFDVVNAHVHAEGTVALFEDLLDKPIEWNFGDDRRRRVAIKVNRHSEDGSHVTLDGKRMALNWTRSREMGREIRDSESLDVVSHEAGHLILHALRGHLDDDDPETGAFHEAFGDIATMLYALSFDANVERMARQTGGDWRKSNIISNYDEQDGKATNLHLFPDCHFANHIRGAVNDMTYRPPETMRESSSLSPRTFSPEPHDFSKLFTGAFYDALTGMMDQNLEKGMQLEDAIRAARDRMGEIWGKALPRLPRKRIRFADAAQAMLDANREMGGGEIRVIRRAFRDRGIACS